MFSLLALLASVQPLSAGATAPTFTQQSRVGYPAGDDWEPTTGADQFGHLYLVYYHGDVSGQTSCAGCNQHLLAQRSDDDGQTWTAPVPIARGTVKGGQFDPWLLIDPTDGRTVWVSFMQGFPKSQIELVKSSDFGVTWSAPAVLSSSLSTVDKDVLAIGAGRMAAFFDDYYTLYASVSLDAGQTWALHPIETFRQAPKQLLCSGAGIDSQGNLYSAWNVYDSTVSSGSCRLWVEKSSNAGQTWTTTDMDVGGDPYPCSQCGAGAYLAPQIALRIGSDDTIYLLWNDTTNLSNGAPERIFFSKSTNHGLTYSPRQELSGAPTGTEHCFPALVTGAGAGDVRAAWMDTRTGVWNVFYRESVDGGASFGAEARVSSYVPGYSYLTAQGFLFPYGDYFQMSVDACGATHIAFGESAAYKDTGNIWVSNQQRDWLLDITRLGNQLRLSWPASFAQAKLEHAVNPRGPWSADSTPSALAGNQWVVLESAAATNRAFYRLRCP